jgi:HNH endonuclease
MNKKLNYRKNPPHGDVELLAALRDLLDYDTVHGGFTVKKTGKPAGHSDGKGYLAVRIGHSAYKLHRLVWLWHNQATPPFLLDHVNGDRKDNRIENLRSASDLENVRNRIRQGKFPMGVSKNQHGRYCARIQKGSEKLYLGYYDTPEEAGAAYAGASIVLYGNYAPKLSRGPAEPV